MTSSSAQAAPADGDESAYYLLDGRDRVIPTLRTQSTWDPATQQGPPVCGLLGWGCPPLGFIGLWLGYRARKAIQESGGQLVGDGIALAGMIVGGITGGLGLLMMLLYFGAIAVAFGVTGFK